MVIARGSWECRVSGGDSHGGVRVKGGRREREREREGRLAVLTTAFNHFERPDRRCKIQLELTAVLSVLIPLLEFCMKMYF